MGIKSRPVTAVVITLVLCMLVGCSDDESVTEVKQSKTIFINFFKINPLATYLHVCSDPGDPWYDDGALNAQPILLADYNIVPGDSLKFDVIGDFFNGNNPRSRVIAVFSSSETLLNGSETQRVPGALEAGEDFVTIDTHGCGGETTDIPEDFYCTPTVSISVPTGATHLFICARDSYYEDNTDGDDNFGLNISRYK